MVTTSRIAWLTSSSNEIARARAVLKSLTPTGVIDELGFLVLAGAFSDYFYPAITTPMTRARYLILVPAIYQYLERSGAAIGKDAERVVRDVQFDLLQRLLQNDPDGAIGKLAGWKVERLPSDIYWIALGTLGLRRQSLSEPNYQRGLSQGLHRSASVRDDDDANHPEDVESAWDSSLRLSYLLADGQFPTNTSFRLRKSEAALLLSRFEALQLRGHASLTARLVAIGRQRGIHQLEGLDHLWQVPGLPPALKNAAEQGRMLSLFARGATLQYHRMLIEKKQEPDPGAAEAFVGWWNYAHEHLRKWDVDAFFLLIAQWNADRRPRDDREFIRPWLTRCLAARNGEDALNDAEARRIIAHREQRVRRGRERLRVQYQLDAWRPPVYPAEAYYQLGYRHRVGRRFAEDILEGLQGAA